MVADVKLITDLNAMPGPGCAVVENDAVVCGCVGPSDLASVAF